MDTSPLVAIGQQLQDFLIKQFSPPPGAKCELGFLGSGIAVEPESFLSQGQFNPARINTWLSIAADPLSTIIDGRVAPTQWTATQLMQAICATARSTAPVGSDTASSFAKIKSQAMENLDGMMNLNTAPLDWYDPAQVPQWSHYSFTASTSDTSQTGPVVSPPPPRPSDHLWSWRRLPQVLLEQSPPVSVPPGTEVLHKIERSPLHLATMPLMAPAVADVHMAVAPQLVSLQTAGIAQTAQVSNAVKVASIERYPNIMIAENAEITSVTASARISSRAIAVSHAISQAADQAVSSSVSSSSLSINLSYLFVELSRTPWWNELLITLNDWYVPGQQRATFVADATDSQSIGVPVALVLTNNVQIQGTWSQSDLSAISSNTHIGPWALSGYQMTSTNSLGQATLTLPGMQMIACIYRLLPPLPPVNDPTLPGA